MIYISTYPLPGESLTEFADAHAEDMGYELFYDNLSRLSAGSYEGRMKELIEQGKVSVHCPMEGCDLLADDGTELMRHTIDMHKRCFELAQAVGAPYVVIHPCSLEPFDSEKTLIRRLRLNERMYMTAGLAEPYGVKILLENIGSWRENSLMVTEEDFIALSKGDRWGMLLDTGHANVNGWDIPSLIRKLGSRIKGFHLHDNDGMTDSHQPIYNGTIPWNDVFAAISEMPSPPDLTVEYNPKYADDIMDAVEVIRNELPHKAK